MDFDSITDDAIQELIESLRVAQCASCRSEIANPDDLHILDKIQELDPEGTAVNVAEWPLIHVRIKGRPYCECCHLAGHATGRPDEGAKYHEQMTSREFRANRRQLEGV